MYSQSLCSIYAQYGNCGKRVLTPEWPDNVENRLWMELLQPFTSVKNLYLSEEFARRIVPVLQEVGGRTTEVLPTPETIFLEGPHPSGPVLEGIEQFVATRQVTRSRVSL